MRMRMMTSFVTLVAMSSRTSIFLSISCERDPTPSPASNPPEFQEKIPHLANLGAKSASPSLRAFLVINKGVTFSRIEEGGVELLLPPQQIRARHG